MQQQLHIRRRIFFQVYDRKISLLTGDKGGKESARRTAFGE